MNQSETYQEHIMPNGTYVIENRLGYWMVWAPRVVDGAQPLISDPSYDLVKLIMEAHSNGEAENDT